MFINSNVKLALEKLRKGLYLLEESIDNSKDKKNSKLLLNILNGEGTTNCTQSKYMDLFEYSLPDEVSEFAEFVDFFFDKYKWNFELSREDNEENSIKKLTTGFDLIINSTELLTDEVKNTPLLKELLRYDIIYDLRIIKSPFRRLDISTLTTKFIAFKETYLHDIKNIIGEENYKKAINFQE